jgi:hypothetical protein
VQRKNKLLTFVDGEEAALEGGEEASGFGDAALGLVEPPPKKLRMSPGIFSALAQRQMENNLANLARTNIS